MVSEHIERLKREYTDRYVVVDESRPELRRFAGMVGQVKTVNHNGRALVQFDGLNNTAWYDIEVDFLRVVEGPALKEAAAKPPTAADASPAPAAESSKLEKARALKAAEERLAAEGAPAPKPASKKAPSGDGSAGAASSSADPSPSQADG